VIDLKIKELFFDRAEVLGATDKATRQALSKFGAFVRQTAKSSIRSRKAVSQPGQPPSSHVGTLKRLIFFGYDAAAKSVVIGPMPFNGQATVPELLEQDHVAGTTRRARGKSRGEVVTMTYRARPFMGPAMEQEKKKLPSLWAASVK